MLPLSRYAPGAYPPNLGFPQLGGAKVQRYFKKYDALQQSHLAGMTERKQGLREIHQARVEERMPPAILERGDPLEQWYEASEGSEIPPVSTPMAQTPREEMPNASGPPEDLGPRPDRMGAALRATSTGLRFAGSAAKAGVNYATAGSRMLVGAGVDAAVASTPLIQYIGSGVGAATTAVVTPLAMGAASAGAAAIEHGIPAATAIVRGAGSVAMGAGSLAIERGLPAASAMASTAGSMVRGAGSLAAVGGQMATERGVPAAKAAMNNSIYVGSELFRELIDIIGNMPQAPAMDVGQPHLELNTHWSSPVNNALEYGPVSRTRQRRSASPVAQTPYVTPPTAATAPAAPQARPRNYRSFNTADEWRAYSKGKGGLGQQLMLRPAFIQAERAQAAKGEGDISQNGSRQRTAQKLKGLSADEMIHLLLKLDHDH